jgi:hypothetical protein
MRNRYLLLLAPAIMAQTITPPAVNDTGGTAAFGLDGNLYVWTQGSDPRWVAGGGVTEVALSPDGTRVAYTAGGAVRILDIATGEERTVADAKAGSPHYSPDGTALLYRVEGNRPLRVAADGRVEELRVYTAALAASPQRVIDRAGRLVFTSSAPFGPTFAAAAADVWIADLAGSELRAITHFGNRPEIQARNAVISAAGGLVAFESNHGDGAVAQVWIAGADGSGLTQFTSGTEAASGPSLSAAGDLLAWVRGGRAWLARTDSPESARALSPEGFPEVRDVALSADGSRAVFTAGPSVYSVETRLTIE